MHLDSKAHIPMGVKLLAVLHWVFGIVGLLMLMYQITEFAYLPQNLQVMIYGVTAADSTLLFIVGAGLLTMKKRWIDTAIVISIVSIAAFYVIPLRPAFPLEVFVVLYLVHRRGGLPLARLKHAFATGLLVFAYASFSTASFNMFMPYGALVRSHEVVGDHGFIKATMKLYKASDSVSTMDFYYLETTVHCSDRKFNYLMVNACVTDTEAEATSWLPHANPGSVFETGLGVAAFSCGPSKTVSIEFGKKDNPLVWKERLATPADNEVFSAEYWVPEGANITWTLTTEARLLDRVFGILWSDAFAFSNAG